MDEGRRFRFLVPPFFFAGSLAVSLHFAGHDLWAFLTSHSSEQLLALGAVIGASVLPLGFLLTSISILVLHSAFRALGYHTYEAVLPSDSWKRIAPLLETSLAEDRRWHLYASATFDHSLLPSGVHDWIHRRWTIFNLSVHSVTAVVTSHLAALTVPIRETWGWILVSLALVAVFGGSAVIAWRHTMRMLAFQASRDRGAFAKRPDVTPPFTVTSLE
jgi:hypothetical protein